MIDEVALRGFLARILGWSSEQTMAVEIALRAIRLSVTHCAALVLLGDVDLAPIAYAIHRRTLGVQPPFVLCNPRRLAEHQTTRSLLSRPSGIAALEAARGGSLCIRATKRPRDFSAAVALARDPATDTQIIVCAEARHADHPFLILPAPIRIPPLKERTSELPRIVDEYAREAIAELGAGPACFTHTDRQWILAHACETLTAIETATRRLVALRAARNTDQAAETLGMAGAALRQWRSKRRRRGGSSGVRCAHSGFMRVAL